MTSMKRTSVVLTAACMITLVVAGVTQTRRANRLERKIDAVHEFKRTFCSGLMTSLTIAQGSLLRPVERREYSPDLPPEDTPGTRRHMARRLVGVEEGSEWISSAVNHCLDAKPDATPGSEYLRVSLLLDREGDPESHADLIATARALDEMIALMNKHGYSRMKQPAILRRADAGVEESTATDAGTTEDAR